MVRNVQIDVVKGLGIFAVVAGHIYAPISWYQPYSFHMPLFYFISGYLFKPDSIFHRLEHFKSRLNSLLIPYFLYNLFFATIYFLINPITHSFQNAADIFSPYTFLVRPFLDGHQYPLYSPAWFVISLFCTQIIFVNIIYYFTRLNITHSWQFMFFFLIALAGIRISDLGIGFSGDMVPLMLAITRSMFGIFFIYAGYFYRDKLEKHTKFSTGFLLLAFTLEWLIVVLIGDHTFNMANAYYKKTFILLPFITSFLGIYLCFFLAKYISLIVKPNNLIVRIGRSSFHIMALHLLIFFFINLFFVVIRKAPLDILSNAWAGYNVPKSWFIYYFTGLLVPTYFHEHLGRVLSKITTKLEVKV